MKEKYNLVTLEILKNKNLKISLTKEGKSYAKQLLKNDWIGSNAMLCDLLEEPLCNGWQWILPEWIGALTDAPIISNDAEINDEGDLVWIDNVWGYMDYMVFDPIEELVKHNYIILQHGDD
jgi:hypothetical protein